MDREELIQHLLTNCKCGEVTMFTEEVLNEKSDEDLVEIANFYQGTVNNAQVVESLQEGVTVNQYQITLTEDGIIINADDDGSEEEEEEELPNTNSNADPKQIKLEDLPADLQGDILYARNKRAEEKTALINKITANKRFESFSEDELKAMDEATLNKLADAAGEPAPAATGLPQFGQPTDNASKPDPKKGLEVPVLNFHDDK